MTKKTPSRRRKADSTRPTKKITKSQNKAMTKKARKKKAVSHPPALDVSLPVAHAGEGYRVAETFLDKNSAGILDIVLPKGTRVEAWCAYGRVARGKKREWVVVSNHPDLNRRYTIPVPRTQFYVWGFGEVPAESETGETVWRLHGHNVAISRTGREVCLRVVLRLAPVAVPLPRGTKRLPPRSTGAPKPRPTPVRIPA